MNEIIKTLSYVPYLEVYESRPDEAPKHLA